jgi:hypothetical protein
MYRYHCIKCNAEIEREEMIESDFIRNPRGKDILVYREKCSLCGHSIAAGFAPTGFVQHRGDYNFVSESLAVPVHQIDEHRAMYPDVDVQKDGTLHFTSVAQQDRYYRKSGFNKVPQKTSKLGSVRIA